MFWLCSYFLSLFVDTQTLLNLPDGRETHRQKYTRGLIVDRTRKTHSDISPTLP